MVQLSLASMLEKRSIYPSRTVLLIQWTWIVWVIFTLPLCLQSFCISLSIGSVFVYAINQKGALSPISTSLSLYHIIFLVPFFLFSSMWYGNIEYGTWSCRYVVSFLKEHGNEVYTEVRGAYMDTMNKVNPVNLIIYLLNELFQD